MKQLLAVLLLGCMGITMVGCGNTESAEVEAMSETQYLGQDIDFEYISFVLFFPEYPSI